MVDIRTLIEALKDEGSGLSVNAAAALEALHWKNSSMLAALDLAECRMDDELGRRGSNDAAYDQPMAPALRIVRTAIEIARRP